MASDTSNALNAIGTLIGYIGTEVATDDFFDRLLWPRRAYNGLSWRNIPKMALLMPMGGPLHKAALSTLDDFYKHGLFEHHQQGHMLGTAFYRDTHLKYRAYGDGPGWENEYVRNGMWVRAVKHMRFPVLDNTQIYGKGGDIPKPVPKVRQKICVSRLTLTRLSAKEKNSKMTIILDDTGRPNLRTYIAHFTTESSAIVVAILVATLWRSAFAALWLLPLGLKILSTIFTLGRDKLQMPELPTPKSSPKEIKTDQQEEVKLFGVRNPAGGFMIIEAPDSLALQFFRHYGHPVRSKNREILQVAIVVAFTFVFPIGLVCSTLWMSDALQKMWVGYQLYATLAMYVYRYAGGHLWATTEERIGDAFFRESVVVLKAQSGECIVASLTRTCHGRYGEALAHVEQMIAGRPRRTLSPSGTLCEERAMLDSPRNNSSDNSGCGSIGRRNTADWD